MPLFLGVLSGSYAVITAKVTGGDACGTGIV